MARQFLNPLRWHPCLAVALLVLLLVGSNLLLLRLKINNSLDIYLPPHAPTVEFNKALRAQFPEDQVLVLLFQGDDVYGAPFLDRLEQVTRRIERLPLVERVFTANTLDHIAGSDDGFVVEPLLGAAQVTDLTFEERRARVLADRFAPGLIASRDGTALALVIRPVALDDSLRAMELIDSVQELVQEAGIEGRLAAVAGHVALDVAQLQAMIHDSLTFVPATMVVGLLLIWWLFRRPLAVGLAAAMLATTVSVTVAVVALWGRPYTLVASMIPPLLAALTTALMIHVFNAMQYASRLGKTGAGRAAWALAEVNRPALFTSLTTAAGLASLALSPIPPIQTFGIAAGIGVLLMYLVVIGSLPALLVRWDKHPWPLPRGSVLWLNRAMRFSARLAIRRAGWVVIGVVILIAAGLPSLFKVEAETDLYQFFAADHPLTQSTHRVEQALSGVTTLEVVFDGPGRDALKEPERLAAIKAFQIWLDGLPQVDRTLSMVDMVEEMHWAFNGEQEGYRVMPANARLISQYLFIYDGRDLYELVDTEFQRTRLTLNLNVTGANATQAVIDKITARLREQPPGDLKATVGGYGRLFADQEDLLVTGQTRSLIGAVALIFLMILVLWRSFWDAVVCMLPNISPIVVIFIAMGSFGVWLDMATAMIASVAVGVAVDDTIHIYHGFKHRIQAGRGPVLAVVRTFRQAGRAVIATTLVLCVQLVMLGGSDFVPTAEFGLLTALGLAVAMLFDILFFPAVLILLHTRQRPARAAPIV